MTVIEYDDRIVLVDVGLRFSTVDMMGIDLVLPDFAYLRGRAADIEAIVVTHGHEDHLGWPRPTAGCMIPLSLPAAGRSHVPTAGRPGKPCALR